MRRNLNFLLAGLALVAGCCSPSEEACGPNWYFHGCDQLVTRFKAHECGTESYECYERQIGQRRSCHFRDGFLTGYRDIVEGGQGDSPAVPPERYWSSAYRTCEGHSRAAEWFSGFQAGAERARLDGMSEFNTIPTLSSLSPDCNQSQLSADTWAASAPSVFPNRAP